MRQTHQNREQHVKRQRTFRDRLSLSFLWVVGAGGLVLLWCWMWQEFYETVPGNAFRPEARRGGQAVHLAEVRHAGQPGQPVAGPAVAPGAGPAPAADPAPAGGPGAPAAPPAAAEPPRDAWHPLSTRTVPLPDFTPAPGRSRLQAFEEIPWTDRIAWIDRYEYVPFELLVKFNPDTPAGTRDKVVTASLRGRVKGTLGADAVALGGAAWTYIALPHSLTVRQALELLVNEPAVAYAEPNYVRYVLTTPNDTRYGELWGLNNTGQTGGTAGADIRAQQAWDLTTGGDVIVADIDTGIDYNHADLAANMWKNAAEANGLPGVDDDGNGLVDDIYGYDYANNDSDPMDDNNHGSHTSGTIAAVGNNGVGVTGVAWHAKLMALKFLTASGSGSTAAAVQCINYARAKGARIMSNSWGGGGYSQSLKDAVDAAGAAGILFVAAAGNNGTNNDTSPFYPACLTSSNLISVAATTSSDGLASFSNFGAATVHLGAPGVGILSTTPGNTYSSFSGTSMATPHVSGVAALVVALNPAITVAELKNALLSSVDPIAALAGKTVTGGRLNAFKAVQTVRPPGAHLAYLSQAIVDDGSAGTTGNGDGIVNPGETVRVRVTVRNNGSVAATAGAGSLVSGDGRALVAAANDSFGDVASGATAAGANGFLVSFGAAIPSGTAVPFTLTTSASNQAPEASNFTVPVLTSSTISGTVTDSVSGAVMAGATVAFSGPRTSSVLTAADGTYTISPAPNGTYSLTASAAGHAPSAPRSVTVPPSAAGVNFSLVPLASISGTVSTISGGVAQPLAGLTVRLTGAATQNVVTAANGTYSFSLLGPGIYTVTPQGTLYAFTPANRSVNLSGTSLTGLDFTATLQSSTVYTKNEVPGLAIPDAYDPGVVSSLNIPDHATIADVNIYVLIHHTWIGDLTVRVVSPAGTSVLLHNLTGGSTHDIDTWYDTLTIPAQSLAALNGQDAYGTWQLQVADHYSYDVGTLDTWKVEVVTAASPGPVLAAAPLSVYVRTPVGTNPASVPLYIQNTGGGTLNWTVSDNAPWLSENVSAGVNSGTVLLMVNTAFMGAGIYNATVVASAAGAGNSPLSIPVTLELTGGGAAPAIGVNPASLAFVTGPGGASPPAQTITVSNLGGGSLAWTVTSNAAWLSAVPASGGAGGTTNVSANPAGLAPGVYNGQLSFADPNASNSPVVVPVTLTTTDSTPPAAVTNLAAAAIQSGGQRLPLVVASSTGDMAGYPAAYLVDGNSATSWISYYSYSPAVTFDLGSTQNINRVRLLPSALYPSLYPSSLQILTSLDGAGWTLVASQAGAYAVPGTWFTLDFPQINARWVRLSVLYCPYRVTSLAELEVYSSYVVRQDALRLTWTAPGDDGNTGRATSYDIRYSLSPITDANWASATQATGEPLPANAGSAEAWILSGLRSGRTYYVALKTLDEVGNVSPLSNIATATVPGYADLTPPSPVGNLAVSPAPDGAGAGGALSASLVSSSGAAGAESSGAAALDGRLDTCWRVNAATAEVDEHLVLDLGASQTLGGFRLHPDPQAPEAFPAEYALEVSADLSAWEEVTSSAGARKGAGGVRDLACAPVVARYARLRVRRLAAGADGSFGMSLAEVEALQSAAASTTALVVSWTAVGDDGLVGRATSYDLRYSAAPINTDADFAAALPAAGLPLPQPSGYLESYVLRGLSASTVYYVRLKVTDDEGNVSGLSNLASGRTADPPDLTPPAAVNNLAVSQLFDGLGALPDRLQVRWSATGDDGMSGRATSYDLRYSTAPITDANWPNALQAIGEPAPALPGTSESLVVSGLAAGTTYYFAIKVADEVANVSALSNVASGATGPARDTVPPAAVYDLRASSLGGLAPRLAPVAVYASSAAPGYGPLRAADGSAYTDWVSYPAYPFPPQNLTLDLGSVQSVTKVRLQISSYWPMVFPMDFRIQTSADGALWQTVTTVLGFRYGAAGAWLEYPFAATSARYVRLQVDHVILGAYYTAVAEFEAYGANADAQTNLDLYWTATGDDGYAGQATRYDLRISTAPISDANFASATPVAGVPAPQGSGAPEHVRLTGLAAGTTYYAAIKVIDDVGNVSPISNLASGTTQR